MDEQKRSDEEESRTMENELKELTLQFEAELTQHQKTQTVIAETVKRVKVNIREIKQRAMEKDALIEKLERKRTQFRQHLQRAGGSTQTKMHQSGGGVPSNSDGYGASRVGHYA